MPTGEIAEASAGAKTERDVIEITLLQKRSLERAAFILGRSIRTIVRRRNDALERLAAMPEFRA